MSPRRSVLLAALLMPAIALAAPEGTRAVRRLKVAVSEVKVLYGDPQLEALLSEVALTEAGSFRGLDTIGRSDIQSMLGFERQRQLLGCTEDASCLAELGGALGVDYLLYGTVGKVGTVLRLDLKLVDAKRARVVGRVGETVDGGPERLVVAVQEASRRLLLGIAPGDPGARSSAPSRLPGWITLGAGGAVLLTGAGVGLSAQGQYDQLKRSQNDVGYATTYASKAAAIHRQAVIADVLMGVGAVTTGVGAWLWWHERSVSRVAVLPSVGADSVGLVAVGRF